MNWSELLEVTWKTMVVYFFLVTLTRIIGTKLLSQTTYFDFVIGITLGTMGGAYVVRSTRDFYVLFSPVILTVAVLATGFISLKSLRMRRLLEGDPVVLIQNGRIQYHRLFRTRYNIDNLLNELRVQGVFNLHHVECAILEPHGRLSVLKKSPYQSLTPADLGLAPRPAGLSADLIKDGEIIDSNLKKANLDRAWLEAQLKLRGIGDATRVFLASLNSDGLLYLDMKDDCFMSVYPTDSPPAGSGMT